MDQDEEPRPLESGVLAVLAGAPLEQAAVTRSLNPAELATAVKLYQAAGRAALASSSNPSDWYQVHLQFTHWDTAEAAAVAHLHPELLQCEAEGMVATWWFIRKAPCWRLRFRSGPGASHQDMIRSLARVLDTLVARNAATRWWESTYEPEVHAFGGPRGMDIAHHLFHQDSRAILIYLSERSPEEPPGPTLGRRELSLLLCSTLMRAAGQEWSEQGDIWSRVTEKRPLPPGTRPDLLNRMMPVIRHLLTVDTSPTSELMQVPNPLAYAANWMDAFGEAGRALVQAAGSGQLSRGIRAITAHHIIFHWNRTGIPPTQQGILARATRDTILKR